MAHVLFIHHILGRTDGVEAFASDLRSAGHNGRRPGSVRRPRLRRRGRRVRPTRNSSVTSPSDASRRRGGCAPRRRRVRRVVVGSHAGPTTRPDPPHPAARSSTRPACRSRVSGPSGRGRTTCRCRSTARTTTSSSPTRATSTPPASSSPPSAPTSPSSFTYPGDQHLFFDRSLPPFDPGPPTSSPAEPSSSSPRADPAPADVRRGGRAPARGLIVIPTRLGRSPVRVPMRGLSTLVLLDELVARSDATTRAVIRFNPVAAPAQRGGSGPGCSTSRSATRRPRPSRC